MRPEGRQVWGSLQTKTALPTTTICLGQITPPHSPHKGTTPPCPLPAHSRLIITPLIVLLPFFHLPGTPECPPLHHQGNRGRQQVMQRHQRGRESSSAAGRQQVPGAAAHACRAHACSAGSSSRQSVSQGITDQRMKNENTRYGAGARHQEMNK